MSDVKDGPTKAKESGAARQRTYRERLKRGRCIVPVETDRGQAAEKLGDLHALKDWDSEDLESMLGYARTLEKWRRDSMDHIRQVINATAERRDDKLGDVALITVPIVVKLVRWAGGICDSQAFWIRTAIGPSYAARPKI
jgi:hypothetical protein